MLAEETRLDFLNLVREVFLRVDERTQKFLSISLLLVALLHVVVEMKLFMEPNPTANIENAVIICHGSAWNHAEHIPMPKHVSFDGICLEEDQPQPQPRKTVLADKTNHRDMTAQSLDSESDSELE